MNVARNISFFIENYGSEKKGRKKRKYACIVD